jgi:hypothetical protein
VVRGAGDDGSNISGNAALPLCGLAVASGQQGNGAAFVA